MVHYINIILCLLDFEYDNIAQVLDH